MAGEKKANSGRYVCQNKERSSVKRCGDSIIVYKSGRIKMVIGENPKPSTSPPPAPGKKTKLLITELLIDEPSKNNTHMQLPSSAARTVKHKKRRLKNKGKQGI
jgi:hypothetical protein